VARLDPAAAEVAKQGRRDSSIDELAEANATGSLVMVVGRAIPEAAVLRSLRQVVDELAARARKRRLTPRSGELR
jgi:hypothetical protein